MKKFYTVVIAAAMSFGATLSAAVPQAPKVSVFDEPAQEVSLEKLEIKQTAHAMKDATPKADSEENWVKKSTGIWFEGPFAARFIDVDEGQWDVDIYECDTKPGWIRVNPYAAGTPVADLLGRANTEYLEINIADPEKCWFPDWSAFGAYTYGSYCTENEWDNAANYGILKDGIITFEKGTVVYEASKDSWGLLNGEMKIVLDKSAYVDYTVTAEAPFCSDSEGQYFGYAKTDAVATVKIMAAPGIYPMNDKNAAIVKAQGTDITAYAGKKINYGLGAAQEAYTYLYVGLDADGNIQAKGAVISYILKDNKDDWKDIGEATYTEGILSMFFYDVEAEDLKCKVQENVSKPGYYRLVSPYDKHSKGFKSEHGHDHYIYINATDPDHVYVEPSVIGANVPGFGDFACQSWGYSYLDRIIEGENAGVWGKLEENKITVPAFRAHISEYNGAQLLSLYNPQKPDTFAVQLPSESAVDNIAADEASAAPVYYNLQGMRIDEPQNGLFIEVRGNKAVKVCK